MLGFDGAADELTRRWMESGDLPNLERLARAGGYAALDTTIPAVSQASWAALITASNPGKTNIGGPVRRGFSGQASPVARRAGFHFQEVEGADLEDFASLGAIEGFLLRLGAGPSRRLAITLLVAGVMALITVVFRSALRFPAAASVLAGACFAACAGFLGRRFADEIPASFLAPVGELAAEPFWNVLGRAGVRVAGPQVPCAFPARAEENVRILAALSTPDVAGATGSWLRFAGGEAESGSGAAAAGIRTLPLKIDATGAASGLLPGPIAPIAGSAGPEAPDRERFVELPLRVEPDYAARRARVSAGGASVEVAEGAWSECFRLIFPATRVMKVNAVARVCLEECALDASGRPRLRLLVPPLSISPQAPPLTMPISFPRQYARDLAEDVGLFSTAGRACGAPDGGESDLPAGLLLAYLDLEMRRREALLERELARDDWDVLFHVESITDCAWCLLHRFADPGHPRYHAVDREGRLLREQTVSAFGRTFRLEDGLKEAYKEMDRIAGSVLDRVEAGAFGQQALLLVVSGYGRSPLRHVFDANVWLLRNGYLHTVGDAPAGAVDWARTRAYSLGMGEIYINLRGREPAGIVAPWGFAALKAEIMRKLEEFADPVQGHGGRRVVKRAYDAAEVLAGAFSEESGDIILGFAEAYGPSRSALAGCAAAETFDTFGVADARGRGAGCGADPGLARGILFANRRLPKSLRPSVFHVAPSILAIYGVEPPAEWDGEPIDW
ncbi:MAG: alkaline phosphatase family protein [Planctomycetes bacterium]|nr:alkaline phosphatase family protein [Planctomycetota bacterium]